MFSGFFVPAYVVSHIDADPKRCTLSSPQNMARADGMTPSRSVCSALGLALLMPNGAPSWTRPTNGHYAQRLFQEVTLTLTNPSVTRVHFPTVGVECTTDCTLSMPVGAMVPVQIETDTPDTLRIVNTPAWSLGTEPVDGLTSWHITIPMTRTPLPSTPRRVPLAIEII